MQAWEASNMYLRVMLLLPLQHQPDYQRRVVTASTTTCSSVEIVLVLLTFFPRLSFDSSSLSVSVFCSRSSLSPRPASVRISSSSVSSLAPSSALYFRLAFLDALAFFLLFTAALIAARLSSPLSWASTFSASKRRATFRFWDRDRVAWDCVVRPVGRCFSWTAHAVLFCPCFSIFG